MLKILKESLEAGVVTNSFPETVSAPPDAFRGRPKIDFSKCIACDKCSDACPTNALTSAAVAANGHASASDRVFTVSYGDCIFCGECAVACPEAIEMSKEFQLAVTHKEDLTHSARYSVDTTGTYSLVEISTESVFDQKTVDQLGGELKDRIHKLFGRSLHIREIDAGSCNGCEIEIVALNNPVYDIERFGIHFVASPRHADLLLVTGPVTRNMEIALKQTYEATPAPKLVVAVGACGITGGMFGKSYSSHGGVDQVVPVDVYIPGCPPRPEALLHGILLALGRVTQQT